MADSVYDIIHTPKHYALEATAITSLGTGRWGYAQDTRRFIINDAGTYRYFWDSTKLADTTGNDVSGMTLGADLIGSAGITGVTPLGGSSGSAGSVYEMLVGLRDYASGTFVDGSGTATYLPIWTDTDTLSNSIISYVNGVFDVIYPTSGSVTTWRVTNTSNTASSGACVIVGVQGSSATGDAFFATQVAGTVNYILGYDVSASLFTASAGTVLGTGNIFTADGTTFTVVDIANFDAAVSMDTTLVVTGTATFNSSGVGTSSAIQLVSTIPAIRFSDTDAGSNEKEWQLFVNGTTQTFRTRTDAQGSGQDYFVITRSGTGITAIALGEATTNPTLTVLGTGTATFGGSIVASATAAGHAFGAANSLNWLYVDPTSFTPGATGSIMRINGTINSFAGSETSVFRVGGTIVEAASGTHPLFTGARFVAPTVTVGAATVSNTATVYISDAMTCTVSGANYALWVNAGNTLMGGDLSVTRSSSGGTVTQTISNTSSGAGSGVLLSLQRHDTSTGDLTINFTDNSETAFAIGLDTSAGNFVISGSTALGTNNIASFATTSITMSQATTFAADASVTRSNSGSNVLFTISNTSNTASSVAEALIQVAGTSAGDPQIRFGISGGVTYTMGIDNSDGDIFAITYGTALAVTTEPTLVMSGGGQYIAYYTDLAGDSYIYITNANASGGAEITIESNGTGDSYLKLQNASSFWALGLDNSVANDPFVLSATNGLGTNNIFSVSNASPYTMTMSVEIVTSASTASLAGLNLPHGTAPSAPVNGDIWTTTAGLYVRINGVTVGPLS